MGKTPDLGKLIKDGIRFNVDVGNDDIEVEKIRLLKDIWHNQATEIKWLTKIHEELKKANSK